MSQTKEAAAEMSPIQSKLLDMLVQIHSFCDQYGIKYYAIGGTLIGAIRHRGFIPWDDDIDIGMPRPDYDKFLSICDKLSQPLKASWTGNDEGYIYPYAKVYDTSTTVIETRASLFKRGLWIDVFPIDATYEGKLPRALHYLIIKSLKTLVFNKSGAYIPERSSFWRRLRRGVVLAACSPFSKQFLSSVLDRSLRMVNYQDAAYVGNFLGRWGNKETVTSTVFSERILLSFEKNPVYAPIGYDKYLRNIYGDYMALPPIEKRGSEHYIHSIDLDTSYLERIGHD